MKITIDGKTTLQLVPNLLLHVSVRETKNIMAITIEEGGLTEAK